MKNRTTSQLNGVIVLGVQEIGRTSRDGNRSQRLLSKSWLGVIFMGQGECMFGGRGRLGGFRLVEMVATFAAYRDFGGLVL